MKKLVLMQVAFLLCGALLSGEKDNPPASLDCRWTDSPPAIDGEAKEAEWISAPSVDIKPRAGAASATARFLWDRDCLYCLIQPSAARHAKGTSTELFLKPAAGKPGYYRFAVSPENAPSAVFFAARGDKERVCNQPKLGFEIGSAIHDGTLELRIPWGCFAPTNGRAIEGETWTFAVCRVQGETIASSSPALVASPADFHHYEDYGQLKFAAPDLSKYIPASLRGFGPWTGQIRGTPDPPPPFTVRRRFPKATLTQIITAQHEPGTANLWIVLQTKWWTGSTRIMRLADSEENSALETVLDWDRIAYGIAFHPKYKENGYVYIGSNGPVSAAAKYSRISRFSVDRTAPFRLDKASEQVVIEWESDGHNGADLSFGLDGMLYLTSGDGTSDSDAWLSGQDLSRLLAKVLRIDVSRTDAGKNYAIPPDNPFVGQANVRPETWAYGMRNPWRIATDGKTGDVWVGQNGQDMWEQVYRIEKGKNYGWSVYEGSHPFYTNRKAGPDPIALPTVEHSHAEARSLTGGQVYYGENFPELQGMYIYGDWSTGRIWGVKHNGRKIVKQLEIADTNLKITAFGFDSHGELLISDYQGGALYTLERAQAEPANAFPRKLSETGLFESLAKQTPRQGVIPYSVNAPGWNDGAETRRFLALPPDARIDFNNERGWEFPDGTVVVQTLSLSTRNAETRVLLKTKGNWKGYTYLWNDAQTDAEIAPRNGADIDVKNRDGLQRWHVPSRAECLVCHTRAANFVLGLNELQMNTGKQVYVSTNTVREPNQLLVLEALKLLRVQPAGRMRHDAARTLRESGMADGEANKLLDNVFNTRNQREGQPSMLLPHVPAKLARLPDPYDAQLELAPRARAYLHANCSHCHIMAGGGNAAMELEFTNAPESMKVFGVPPLHANFGMDQPSLIAPGDTERSIILRRLSTRGSGQMPPLASNAADEHAVKLFRSWIAAMPPTYGLRANKLPTAAELFKSSGDQKNGKIVFEKTCSICHRVGHRGADFGPDLTQLATRLQRDKIVESVLKPDAVIDEKYSHTAFRLKSGEVLSGIVASDTPDAVILRQTGGKSLTILKKDIAKKLTYKTSAMPTGLENALSSQELIDLIDYLLTLKN